MKRLLILLLATLLLATASMAQASTAEVPRLNGFSDECDVDGIGGPIRPHSGDYGWAYATTMFAVELEYMTRYDDTWQFIRQMSNTTTADAVYSVHSQLAAEMYQVANTPPRSAEPGGDAARRQVQNAGFGRTTASKAKVAAMQRIGMLLSGGCSS